MTGQRKDKPDAAVNASEMTLRDRFAGQALAGMTTGAFDDAGMDEMARAAYRLADAMIKARAGDVSPQRRRTPPRVKQGELVRWFMDTRQKCRALQHEVNRLNAELNAARRPPPKRRGKKGKGNVIEFPASGT